MLKNILRGNNGNCALIFICKTFFLTFRMKRKSNKFQRALLPWFCKDIATIVESYTMFAIGTLFETAEPWGPCEIWALKEIYWARPKPYYSMSKIKTEVKHMGDVDDTIIICAIRPLQYSGKPICVSEHCDAQSAPLKNKQNGFKVLNQDFIFW